MSNISDIYNTYKDQITDLLDQSTSGEIDIVEMMAKLGLEVTDELRAEIEADKQEE